MLVAVINSLASDCAPNGAEVLGAMGTVGIVLHGVALLAVVSLPRTRKYGRFMHGVPYAFLIAGGILLVLAPDAKDPLLASLIFVGLTAIMHAAVCFEMRADMKRLYGSSLGPVHPDYVRSLQAMRAAAGANCCQPNRPRRGRRE
ncbi:hypothetical protein ACH79_37280 [Bradyrhizobium sp. CCBAU 051011]|nr:hypothetical protein ACH79_37280 [Bradyrhizobium sp. CCBAU 051011]